MASEALFDGIPPFPADVPTAVMTTVPLELLRDGNDQAEKDILTASTDFGFFLLDIRGDSMGSVLIREIDALFSLCQEVMNLPADVKSQHEHDFPRSFLGFKPLGQAQTEKGEPDRYESFNFGQDGLMETEPLQSLPLIVYDRLPLVKSYLRHCQEIVALLNKALARQLKLPEDAFSALQSPEKPSGTMIRLLKAHASPEEEDLRTALIHHRDFGTLTLLANVLGGLQILRPGGSPEDESAWLWARPLPGHLIVNIGDVMNRWTGGILRSSMHRVRHAPGAQRFVDKYSVVYLVRAEREASMRRLVKNETTTDSNEEDEDDNLTAWEWEVKQVKKMLRTGYAPSSKAVQGQA